MSHNEILKRIRNGGQQELALIYEKYRAEFLYWIARSFPASMEDSKDIYQFAILAFYENIRSGKLQHLISSVKTYLFSIGKNIAREYLRKAGRLKALRQRPAPEYVPDDHDHQHEEYLHEAARKAVARLEEPRRKLIELYYFEKKSMAEISTLLDYKNADTAKNQKCKSMTRLRQLFQDEVSKDARLRAGEGYGLRYKV